MPEVDRSTTSLAWIMALIGAFVLVTSGIVGPRFAFASLCHQLPSRSFTYGNHLFAVCHRCIAIYAGLFIGLLVAGVSSTVLMIGRKWALWMLALAAFLVAVDAGLDAFGLVRNTVTTRVVTGSMLGLTCGLFLATITQQPKPRPAAPAMPAQQG